jgi:hypothetical protein
VDPRENLSRDERPFSLGSERRLPFAGQTRDGMEGWSGFHGPSPYRARDGVASSVPQDSRIGYALQLKLYVVREVS